MKKMTKSIYTLVIYRRMLTNKHWKPNLRILVQCSTVRYTIKGAQYLPRLKCQTKMQLQWQSLPVLPLRVKSSQYRCSSTIRTKTSLCTKLSFATSLISYLMNWHYLRVTKPLFNQLSWSTKIMSRSKLLDRISSDSVVQTSLSFYKQSKNSMKLPKTCVQRRKRCPHTLRMVQTWISISCKS